MESFITTYTLICFAISAGAQFMPPSVPFPFPFPALNPGGLPAPAPPGTLRMPPGTLVGPPGPFVAPAPGAPLPFPMTQPKLPVVVMPYYSKHEKHPASHKKKRKPPKKYKRMELSSESGSDSGTASDEPQSRASRRPKKKIRELLTPVISYVTKDGYVVYQKKIKKDKAKDWLNLGKNDARQE